MNDIIINCEKVINETVNGIITSVIGCSTITPDIARQIVQIGITDKTYREQRLIIATKILAGLVGNPGGPYQENPRSGWGLCNCNHSQIANVAITLADSLLTANEITSLPNDAKDTIPQKFSPTDNGKHIPTVNQITTIKALDKLNKEYFLIQETLDSLTDEERLTLISHYCKHCGRRNSNCQCQNDE
jgi:hypothetical protein